jgi:tripartite-type tricarboxylate transporter receptor subunit TctC
MRRRSLLIGGGAALAASLARPAVHAQAAWPAAGPIRIIVPFPPGAANDAMGRLAAQKLQEKLGATVIVENRPGGAAVIGTTAVLRAAPDGYTLLASAFNHIVLNHVVRGVAFDPQKDFDCLARTARAPLVMVMAPNRPERTVPEIAQSVRQAPNDWTFAIANLGAPGHLATIDFMHRTGLNFTITPYRGTAPALTDVLGGHVQLLIDSSFALVPSAADGKVKAIGITTRTRSPVAPQIPTMAEVGLPDFVHESWYGLWAPKGTPLAIRQQINTIMRDAMADPEVIKRLQGSLLEPVRETIGEMETFIAGEVQRQVALLKSINFQPE